MKQAILNLDTNFFAMPSYHGNGMVVKDFNNTGNLKRTKWLEVDDFIEKLSFKRKRGDIVKKATSLLYEYQIFDLTNLDFIHIGMHNHVYSYESWGNLITKINHNNITTIMLFFTFLKKWVYNKWFGYILITIQMMS